MKKSRSKTEENKVKTKKTERIEEFPYVYTKKTDLYGQRCVPLKEVKYAYMGRDVPIIFENGLKKIAARSNLKHDNTGKLEKNMRSRVFSKEEVIEKILELSKRPEGRRKKIIFNTFRNSNHSNKSIQEAIKEARKLGMDTVPSQYCSKLLTLYKYQSS